jgi:hypothetical protein
MEDFSRRVLVALVVAAAGPGAGMLTLLVVGPTLVAASATQSDGSIVAAVAGGLVGLVIGGLLSAAIAYVVAAAATLAAFRTTGCPRPTLAWILCLVVSPLWLGALSTLDLDVAGWMLLVGALPGAVRLGFGYLELPGSRTGDLVREGSTDPTF